MMMAVSRQRSLFRMRMRDLVVISVLMRLVTTRMAMKVIVHGAVDVLMQVRVERFLLHVHHTLFLCPAHRLYPL